MRGTTTIPRRRIYPTNAARQAAYRRRQKASVHFRSKTHLWSTPPEFFRALDQEFGFELDVCALPENAKCERYFSPKEDGLKQNWQGVCWMNPPYGREISRWVEKAYLSAAAGATVVCQLPARTDTQWWHRFVMQASEVRYIPGRLKFGENANSAPFPSAVVIFRSTFVSGTS
jgi:phage N-6-adenine-methyltransferase